MLANDLSLVVASVGINEAKSGSHDAGGDDGRTMAAGRKTTWTPVGGVIIAKTLLRPWRQGKVRAIGSTFSGWFGFELESVQL